MTARTVCAGSMLAILAMAAARPVSAQTYDWQNQWYWGIKGGVLSYQLPSATVNPTQVGGEWLITARRTALYVGYSQSSTAEQDNFTVPKLSGGPYNIGFNGMRRIQIGVVVLPTNGAIQPYVGGGFVIETLTGAQFVGFTPSTAQANALSDAASGGFALVMAGLQLRVGRRLAAYGQYQGSPQGRDFLLTGSSNSIEAGLRYAFLPSREVDVGQNR